MQYPVTRHKIAASHSNQTYSAAENIHPIYDTTLGDHEAKDSFEGIATSKLILPPVARDDEESSTIRPVGLHRATRSGWTQV